MPKILFIGNFLARHRGTKGVIERLVERKDDFNGVTLILKSHFSNKLLRFIDILLAVCFAKYELIFIDVYSGLFFKIVQSASRVASIRNKKVFFILHGGKLHELERKNPIIFAKVMIRGSKLLTPSNFLINEFAKHGYALTYLPNFLDLQKFPYGENAQSLKILWIRAFASIYNPQMAIRVLNYVRERVPSVTLTMVGPDHGELLSCLELIDSLGLNEVITITGKVENDKLSEFYHSHGVFINTTFYESFGLAVLEAASCGIPIVSNDIGEIPYLWKDEEEILLCKPDDERDMGEKVIRLLQKPTMATSLSVRARMKAEQFSWEAVKPLWEKLMKGDE